MSSMHALESFLASVNAVHHSGGGTKETSYYSALNQLFDTVGHALKPKVRCVMQLKSLGAGNPDGGFFTADQFDRKTDTPKDAGKPARGVVEVKAPSEPVDFTAASKQVDKYWAHYKLVLLTNLREWLLLGERDGKRVALERYTLADNEADFWAFAAHPQAAEKIHGQAFADFLARVLRHNAPLSDPKDLAWLLASYAREARHRVEHAPAHAVGQMTALKASLENALGVNFREEQGDHFFRSTLVQTLFYGLFAAWVLRHEEGNDGPFDWHSAAHDLHVPMVSALFGQLSQPNKLKALNLTEVLDWAGDALNRVIKTEFFAKFEAARSVQYFYEPFLQAFDPALRKELGVWYTPEEIVRYQVARVDEVLRTELGLDDGLAHPDVVVLDPCCGTGAYLVEVLHLIGERMKAQGADALAAHQLKAAVTERLFGFELLPAPYVVAHLQMGLLLRKLGVALKDEERAGIYLTNALTGWEPPKDPKAVLPFPEFSQERDAADQVKQTQKILVVLGNPPYNSYSGVALGEEQDLIAPYKEGLISKWKIKKFNLDELYVRFFRLAERRIAEHGGRGVVSYITNFSYLREPSFVVMREHLQNNFDRIWVDNLNGDSRETGKLTPDGEPDPSVFSTDYNREGIQKGTAVAVMVKRGPSSQPAEVRYRDWWGVSKREGLLQSLDDPQASAHYDVAQTTMENRYSFKPGVVSVDYAEWPTLEQISSQYPFNGLFEKRGGALIDFEEKKLASSIENYFDKSVEWDELSKINHALTIDSARFVAKDARKKLIGLHEFDSEKVVRYQVRPFDIRWCYRTIERPLWAEPRPRYQQQLWTGNTFLVSRPSASASPEGFPIVFTAIAADHDWIRGHAYHFSLFIKSHPESANEKSQTDLFGQGGTKGETLVSANLSAAARSYLSAFDLTDPDEDRATAELLWLHALAIGYSPAYLSDHADGIRGDWPRIPMPADASLLQASAALGRQVAALLDTETAVSGVTSGAIRPELRPIAVVTRVGDGPLQPEEFKLTAGWGHGGKGGITMPGRGLSKTRIADADELAPGLASGSVQTHDIHLNSTAYWCNVPPAVWDFTIGGYQVMKKWLSYREYALLGRPLLTAEIKEVTAMARRLAALVLLQPALDDNYRAVAANTAVWPSS